MFVFIAFTGSAAAVVVVVRRRSRHFLGNY
jgi:hypothetical protein